MSSRPTSLFQSYVSAPFFGPTVVVRESAPVARNSVPRATVDPKFARPTVDRKVVRTVVPSQKTKLVPVRHPSKKINKADLEHTTNAKLRSRSNLNDSRIAQQADDIEVSRNVRTNIVLSVSAETVVR